MQITVPVPTFDRRVCVPVPSLSRKQLLFMGGAAGLGLVDILSAPVAAVLAAAPLLQKGVRRIAESNGTSTASPRRRSTGRRTASPRARSVTPKAGTSRGQGTRRSASRRSGTGSTAGTPSA